MDSTSCTGVGLLEMSSHAPAWLTSVTPDSATAKVCVFLPTCRSLLCPDYKAFAVGSHNASRDDSFSNRLATLDSLQLIQSSYSSVRLSCSSLVRSLSSLHAINQLLSSCPTTLLNHLRTAASMDLQNPQATLQTPPHPLLVRPLFETPQLHQIRTTTQPSAATARPQPSSPATSSSAFPDRDDAWNVP